MKISKLITPMLGLTILVNDSINAIPTIETEPYCYLTPCGDVICLGYPFFVCKPILCDYPARLSAICCNDKDLCKEVSELQVNNKKAFSLQEQQYKCQIEVSSKK